MQLDKRQTAMVLYCLRKIQDLVDNTGRRDAMKSNEHFAEVEPLSSAEIDALCEKINFGDDDGPPATTVMSNIIRSEEFDITPEVSTVQDLLNAGGSLIDGCMDPPIVLFQVEGDTRYWVATIEMVIAEANPEFVKDSLANDDDADYEHDPTEEG